MEAFLRLWQTLQCARNDKFLLTRIFNQDCLKLFWTNPAAKWLQRQPNMLAVWSHLQEIVLHFVSFRFQLEHWET